jgi:uncharacterized protein YrrD
MIIDTFTSVDGRNVVAADTAEQVGSVKGFVLDRAGRQIEALHVGGRGRRASLLDWSAVTAFGTDAVMAAPGADPSPLHTDHEEDAVRGRVTMIGSRVLTIEGREIGTVTDAEFDIESGAIVRIVTDHGSIAAGSVRSLGSYALVVDPTPSAGS